MTPVEGAEWMLNELNKKKILDQEIAAYSLRKLDQNLTYINGNGNLAISKDVLKEFNKVTKGDQVVWSRSERHWRFRQPHDKQGRMQD